MERHDRWILLGWCAMLAVVLGTMAAFLARHHSVWSPDSGALLTLAKSWAAGGSPAYPKYSLESFDPNWLVHPLMGQGYVAVASHGHTLVYSPTLPVIAGTFYRYLGFFGLAIPSVIAAVLAGLAALVAAREMKLHFWPLAGFVGLATPLAVYGVVFWHHAPTICAASWAFYFVVRGLVRGTSLSLMVAGLSLGAGLFFHELSVALFAALFVALFPRWRMMAALTAGFALAAAPWVGMNLALYGKPMGPHVSGANNVLDSHVYRPGLFDISGMLDRAAVQLFGFPPSSLAIWLMALLLIAAWLLRREAPFEKLPPVFRRLRPSLWLLLLATLVAVATWPWDTMNNGLFQTTPLFGLALLVPTANRPERAVALRMCGLFALLVILNPIPPLMGWGSRFLVTVATPLFVLGLAAVEELGSRWLLNLLLVLGVLAQIRGMVKVDADLDYSFNVCEAIRFYGSPVISEIPWMGAEAQAADLYVPLMIVGDTLYTPMDKAAARAKAAEYVRVNHPSKVVLFDSPDPNSPMKQALEAEGYYSNQFGESLGLHVFQFHPGGPASTTDDYPSSRPPRPARSWPPFLNRLPPTAPRNRPSGRDGKTQLRSAGRR